MSEERAHLELANDERRNGNEDNRQNNEQERVDTISEKRSTNENRNNQITQTDNLIEFSFYAGFFVKIAECDERRASAS